MHPDLKQQLEASRLEIVELEKTLEAQTRELAELREQQTATSEVLQIIASSPGDLDPVFQAMMDNAARICAAEFGVLYLYDGDAYRVAAAARLPPAIGAMLQGPLRPGEGTAIGRVARTLQVAHIVDLASEQVREEDRQVRSAAKEFGIRTLLAVPMIKDGKLIGAISFFRKEVKPFAEKQIALVTTFANQAVIAIENTRLLNELRQRTDDLTEALEQQTAASEVLQVISSSPGELEPVFQSILSNATRICAAEFGTLWLCEGDGFRAAALHNTPPALAKTRQDILVRPGPNTALARVSRTRRFVHITDIRTEQAYLEGDPLFVNVADLGGMRTLLSVPMLKDDKLVGTIAITRQEVRPFTDKQIELVTNFAAQAVIAIENTRLLTELRESLQQQTATSDVLGVISSSPGDLGPVFQTMLQNSVRICEAKFGQMFLCESNTFRVVAQLGVSPALAEFSVQRKTFQPFPGTGLDRLARTKQVIQVQRRSCR